MGQNSPEKGVPLLQNYLPGNYQDKGKIWDMNSAPNGIVYFASDGGLLEYDGKTWKSFKGSIGFTRSVLVVSDSVIFTGSDLDFGVWHRNKYMEFEYTSLYPFKEDAFDISEEFWQIYQWQDDILFVSSRNVYVYQNEQLVKIAAPSSFSGSFMYNDQVYFVDETQGLFVFDDFSIQKVMDFPQQFDPEITGLYPHEDQWVLVTRDLGLYVFANGVLTPLNNQLSKELRAAKVFSFEQIDENRFAFGTVLKGLYIADKDGNIIHYVNRQKGLPSNTVLSMHYSAAGKLWMGMDYGISVLDMQNNFTFFYDYLGDYGTAHTALLKDNTFYLGTNQGLYRSEWDELNNNRERFRFQLIPGTEGQVWTLENINNTLFMGHDKGLFTIRGNTPEKLSNHEGVWSIVPYKDYLLTGTYNGISIFHKENRKWTFLKKMDAILGSCNELIVEKDNILWVNIPNFGIIRADLDQNLNPAERLIFTSDIFEGNDAFIQKDEQGLHVFTDRWQYTYNPSEKTFTQIQESNVFPMVEGQLSGFSLPVAINSDYEFYPVYNGFALNHVSSKKHLQTAGFSLALRKFEAFSNHERRLLHPGDKVPYQLNNFHIECIVPNQKDVLYQFKLNEKGAWSEWEPNNTFEFINLKRGEYKLDIRAKVHDVVIEQPVITFRIAAPWYFAWYAFVVYLFLFSLLIYLIYRWQKISLKKQKKKMLLREQDSLRQQKEKHKQEIIALEQKRMQAEYNQIKQQLKNKTIELANKAREDEEKNRLLLTLKEKCDAAQKNPSPSKRQWHEMQRLLDSYINVEDNTFEIQMDELHQEFFKKLKERFPSLSSNDLRLCAYLRIGLNSKEIAEIMNIQPSSSYISRSRLRKKLKLKAEDDLYDFLNGI